MSSAKKTHNDTSKFESRFPNQYSGAARAKKTKRKKRLNGQNMHVNTHLVLRVRWFVLKSSRCDKPIRQNTECWHVCSWRTQCEALPNGFEAMLDPFDTLSILPHSHRNVKTTVSLGLTADGWGPWPHRQLKVDLRGRKRHIAGHSNGNLNTKAILNHRKKTTLSADHNLARSKRE